MGRLAGLGGLRGMSVRADVETFRSIPIFSECEPAHLQVLAFSAGRENFASGKTLIVQGKPGKNAYLLLTGKVELSTQEDGLVGMAGPGALLGEVAMIGGNPYSLTARAVEAVTTAKIDRELFMRVAGEFPEFGASVFRTLARKLDLSMKDLGEARTLFEKARSFRNL